MSGQGLYQTPLIQQLLAILQILPGGHTLASLGVGWEVVPDPTANVRIINNVVSVIALSSPKSFVI